MPKLSQIVLTSLAYDEAHRRLAVRPRLEFRGAGRQRRRRTHSQRGNRHRHQPIAKALLASNSARDRGIDARVIPSKGFEREAYDRLVVAALQETKVDLVCLAGYMRLLSPYFVPPFAAAS